LSSQVSLIRTSNILFPFYTPQTVINLSQYIFNRHFVFSISIFIAVVIFFLTKYSHQVQQLPVTSRVGIRTENIFYQVFSGTNCMGFKLKFLLIYLALISGAFRFPGV